MSAVDVHVFSKQAEAPLKGLDIFIGDLNIPDPRALLHKLLHRLLSMVGLGMPGMLQITAHGRFQQVGGEPAACFAHADNECHGFVPHFVLHGDFLLSKSGWTALAGLAPFGRFF